MERSTLAERSAALLHAGAQVSRNITSILDPDILLAKTVDIICDTFGFYYAGVFLLDETGEWAILRAGRGEQPRGEAGPFLKMLGQTLIIGLEGYLLRADIVQG